MKIKVRVKFAAGTGRELGLKNTEILVSTQLETVLAELEEQTGYAIKEKLEQGYALLINGRSHYQFLQGNHSLIDGDSFMIIPMVGGG